TRDNMSPTTLVRWSLAGVGPFFAIAGSSDMRRVAGPKVETRSWEPSVRLLYSRPLGDEKGGTGEQDKRSHGAGPPCLKGFPETSLAPNNSVRAFGQANFPYVIDF